MGAYLHQLFIDNPLWPVIGITAEQARTQVYSWVIWDVINIAWMINPDWVPSTLVRTPRLSDERYWQPQTDSHLMREAFAVQRDAVFQDFFTKLAEHAKPASLQPPTTAVRL
jgi:hypothetical protein